MTMCRSKTKRRRKGKLEIKITHLKCMRMEQW